MKYMKMDIVEEVSNRKALHKVAPYFYHIGKGRYTYNKMCAILIFKNLISEGNNGRVYWKLFC